MNPLPFQFEWPLLVVLILAVAVPLGNYMINKMQGMAPDDNKRESRMWGTGFIIYAVFDSILMMF